MDSSWGVRGEEMNEGQMVSSAGLSSALQSTDHAESNKHNNLSFFFIGRSEWSEFRLVQMCCNQKTLVHVMFFASSKTVPTAD